MEDIA